jgi:CRISPR-associated protein Cas5d
MTHGVRLVVSGRHACFTRPELKVERVSYDVMTPSAARGILEAIHWKPAIRWIVESIHALNEIRFQSIRRNEVSEKASATNAKVAMNRGDVADLFLTIEHARQQRAAQVLCDVAYGICARFEMTSQAGTADNPAKHLDMFNRRARAGQCFHRPCLGTREFPADFRLVEPGEPMPPAQAIDRDLGLMLHDIDHADGRASLWFRARLERGVMRVPAPGSPEILR